MGCGVLGFGFGVWGSGFVFRGLGFRLRNLGVRFKVLVRNLVFRFLVFKVGGLGFGV